MLPLSILAERIPFLSWYPLSLHLISADPLSLPASSISVLPEHVPWHSDCANGRSRWANRVWLRLWSALLLLSCCVRRQRAALPPLGPNLHDTHGLPALEPQHNTDLEKYINTPTWHYITIHKPSVSHVRTRAHSWHLSSNTMTRFLFY